jgi:hypothetical protein
MIEVSTEELARVSGGNQRNAPLSGDVNQDINTNWGGTQTNIDTQIVNPAPADRPKPTTRIDYLRQNPEARWGPPPYKPRPVR